jgi:hypothetical protein
MKKYLGIWDIWGYTGKPSFTNLHFKVSSAIYFWHVFLGGWLPFMGFTIYYTVIIYNPNLWWFNVYVSETGLSPIGSRMINQWVACFPNIFSAKSQ